MTMIKRPSQRARGMLSKTLSVAALTAALIASPAQAVEVFICWIGNGGYTMTGRMQYPDAMAGQRMIREGDVTAFEITGYFEGRRIGNWTLADKTIFTSWFLQYDTRTGVFPLVGDNGLYQMWNANGYVDDCGNGGFGFNSGNGGQDVCIDGTYIASSTIDWDTPIVALPDQPSPLCEGPALIGRLTDPPADPLADILADPVADPLNGIAAARTAG